MANLNDWALQRMAIMKIFFQENVVLGVLWHFSVWLEKTENCLHLHVCHVMIIRRMM